MRPKFRVSGAITLLFAALASVLLLSGCRKAGAVLKPDQVFGFYDTEADWNDPTKVINLGYRESQGKRLFYQYCVWCHADATPAGPSNRSNLTPVLL